MNLVLHSFKSRIGQKPCPHAVPFTRWLGGVLQAAEEGEVTVEFTVREEMANPAGFLHGGMQAAMIDETIGVAVASLGREAFHVSLNLTVDHLGVARVGQRVLAAGRVIRAGSRVIHAICELSDEATGELIARGTSNLLKTRMMPDYVRRLKSNTSEPANG